jgi:hypothetical protein
MKGKASIRWPKAQREKWVIRVKCTKDERKRLLTKYKNNNNSWQEYFDKHFNENNENLFIELDISSDNINKHFVRTIEESDVKDALKRMKGGKMMGLDGIPIEV